MIDHPRPPDNQQSIASTKKVISQKENDDLPEVSINGKFYYTSIAQDTFAIEFKAHNTPFTIRIVEGLTKAESQDILLDLQQIISRLQCIKDGNDEC